MFQSGKLANEHQEMERLNISILGISEVRWTGSGEIQIEKSKFIYSRGDSHERGVGVKLCYQRKQLESLKATGQ